MAEKNTTQRELTCICCPVGCALTVTIEGDNSVTVTGNRCPRGAAYGEKEVTNPTRIVTSTVRVEGYSRHSSIREDGFRYSQRQDR